MDRNDVIRKIRAARNLAERAAGSEEGRTALRMARELARRYGISAEEVKPRKPPVERPAGRPPPRSSSAPPAASKPAPVVQPQSVPIRLEVRIGGMRIRWKL